MLRLIGRCAMLFWLVVAALLLPSTAAVAEDGYDLWLRYRRLPQAALDQVRPTVAGIHWSDSDDVRVQTAAAELNRATGQILGATARSTTPISHSIVLGTPSGSPAVARLRLDLRGLGQEGYLIRSTTIDGQPVTVVAGNTGAGVLYGTFALIQQLQLGRPLTGVTIRSAPKLQLRVLNHWDNLDGVVERGYAGQSLWDWWTLPAYKDPRYTDYARANASLGINGTVLNNVNAKADSLTAPYIAKAAALADVFRPYGIRVYLSARFTAPMELGGLKTADPLDPQVAAWWRAKADEIWRAIPDFGGFLVKANSEGQPGPRDYKRTHADGANMLAAAVRPHGGIVMWRAFVYAETDPEDRAKQAYTEFKPLDGRFADNVIVQVKNGPVDFQPREPFHPLFGAMPKTALMLELQITKEYLGFNTHLVYLGPLFAEALRADTGRGRTVGQVVASERLSGLAGVANIGQSRTWTGSIFDQANWYAFGRLAWDPAADPDAIARDWVGDTFGTDPRLVGPVTAMMAGSREAAVDYMTPLGLAHLMGTGHHYGPAPWIADLARPEWNPVYYHRADRAGIGFDRTRTGSNAVAQYAPEIARRLANPATTPEPLLLWFHHLPWDYRMQSGRTLWAEMVAHYDRGVACVVDMRRQWAALAPLVDADRHAQTAALLQIQEADARWWRDASVAYWSSINGLPLPPGAVPPEHDLAWYKARQVPFAPGNPK